MPEFAETAALFRGPCYLIATENGTETFLRPEDADARLEELFAERKAIVPFKHGGVWVAVHPEPHLADAVERPDAALQAVVDLTVRVGEFIDSTIGLSDAGKDSLRRAKGNLELAVEDERHWRETRERKKAQFRD